MTDKKDQTVTTDQPMDTPAPAPASDDFQAGGSDKFGRQLYKAVCAKCGGEAMVPFKPTSGRPVYCQNCYRPRPRSDFGGDRRGGGGSGRSFGGPR